MVARLRALGGWSNVDVEFEEVGAKVLNHLRIVASPPLLTWWTGDDVIRYAASPHCISDPMERGKEGGEGEGDA
jgi:hypothetical protein